MANRKLRMLVDSTSAKQGSKEVVSAVGEMTKAGKSAVTTFKQLNEVMKGNVSQMSRLQQMSKSYNPFKDIQTSIANYTKRLEKLQVANNTTTTIIKQGGAESKAALKGVATQADNTAKSFIKLKDTTDAPFSNSSKQIAALAKAIEKLNNTMYAEQARTKALNTELGKNSVKVQEQRRVTEEYTRSIERLKLSYSDEYIQMMKNRVALEQRNKQIREMVTGQKAAVKSTGNLTSSFSMLGTAMAGVAAYFSGLSLLRTADEYTNLTNKLAAVSGGTVNVSNATGELLALSLETRSSLEGTMDVYTKMIRVNEDLGKSQEEVTTLTEAVSKAVSMNGATAQGAQGAMMQFGQAMSSDWKTSAQELNSILEQTPLLAKYMVAGLNEINPELELTTGSLKDFAEQGGLSAELVWEAFQKVLPKIQKDFEQTSQTVESAAKNLSDSFTVLVGELNDSYGVTDTIVESMKELAAELPNLKDEITALTAGLVALVGFTALGGLAAILLAINPIVLGVVGGVTLLTTAFTKLYLESTKHQRSAEETVKDFEKLSQGADRFNSSLQGLSSASLTDIYTNLQRDISETTSQMKEIEKMVDMKEIEKMVEISKAVEESMNNGQKSARRSAQRQGIALGDYEENKAQIEEFTTLEKILASLQERLSRVASQMQETFTREAEKGVGGLSKLGKELENSLISKDFGNLSKELSNISEQYESNADKIDKVTDANVRAALSEKNLAAKTNLTALTLEKYTSELTTIQDLLDEKYADKDPSFAAALSYDKQIDELDTVYKTEEGLLALKVKNGVITQDQMDSEVLALKNLKKKMEEVLDLEYEASQKETGFLGGIKDMLENGVSWDNIAEVLGSGMGSYLVQLFSEGGNTEASSELSSLGGAVGSIWGPVGSTIGTAAGSIIGSYVDEVMADYLEIQAEQFTGGVLGYDDQQTQSIVNSLEHLEELTSELVGIDTSMFETLKETEDSISGVVYSLVKADIDYDAISHSAGVGTSSLDSIVSSLFGAERTISDSGIKIIGDSLTDLFEEVTTSAYQTVKYRKNWFSSTKTTTSTADISDELGEPLSEAFAAIGDTVTSAGEALGYTVNDMLGFMNDVEIATKTISLKGMSSDEIESTLSSYFSSIYDQVSEEVFSFIDVFQEVGESFGDTLTRVTSNYQTVNEILGLMGQEEYGAGTLEVLEEVNTIIETLGGADEAASTWMEIFETFADSSSQLDYTREALESIFEGLGTTLPETADELWNYITGLDLTDSSDLSILSTISDLTDTLDDYYSDLEDYIETTQEASYALEELNDLTESLGNIISGATNDTSQALIDRISSLNNLSEEDAFTELENLISSFEDGFLSTSEQLNNTISSLKEEFVDIGIFAKQVDTISLDEFKNSLDDLGNVSSETLLRWLESAEILSQIREAEEELSEVNIELAEEASELSTLTKSLGVAFSGATDTLTQSLIDRIANLETLSEDDAFTELESLISSFEDGFLSTSEQLENTISTLKEEFVDIGIFAKQVDTISLDAFQSAFTNLQDGMSTESILEWLKSAELLSQIREAEEELSEVTAELAEEALEAVTDLIDAQDTLFSNSLGLYSEEKQAILQIAKAKEDLNNLGFDSDISVEDFLSQMEQLGDDVDVETLEKWSDAATALDTITDSTESLSEIAQTASDDLNQLSELTESFTRVFNGATNDLTQSLIDRIASVETLSEDDAFTVLEGLISSFEDGFLSTSEQLSKTIEALKGEFVDIGIFANQVDTISLDAFQSAFNNLEDPSTSYLLRWLESAEILSQIREAEEELLEANIDLASEASELSELTSSLSTSFSGATDSFTSDVISVLEAIHTISEDDAMSLLSEQVETYTSTFYSSMEQLELAVTLAEEELSDFSDLGVSAATTISEFRASFEDYINSDAFTAEGYANYLAASQALSEYYDAVETLTDDAFSSIIDWLEEITSLDLDGEQSLASAQSQYAAQLALAQAGDTDAMDGLSDYADAVLEAAENETSTAAQYKVILASLVSSMSSLVEETTGTSYSVPEFATGGQHDGGWRVVGDGGNGSGTELEYTGKSQIFNGKQADTLINVEGIVSELNEIRTILRSGMGTLAKNTNKSYKVLDRWDKVGVPQERDF